MSIEDIKISVICDQYMEYINTMQKLDIELSSEFIVMASQLMLIKSRTLLPRMNEDDGEDPAEELARALLEYKRAKEASGKLGGLYSQFSGRYQKDTDEISPDTCRFWDSTTGEKLDKDRFRRDLGDVEAAYTEVMSRLEKHI